jgi:hypothetical protein
MNFLYLGISKILKVETIFKNLGMENSRGVNLDMHLEEKKISRFSDFIKKSRDWKISSRFLRDDGISRVKKIQAIFDNPSFNTSSLFTGNGGVTDYRILSESKFENLAS